MLNIVGGSYIEKCIDPLYHELFGSGIRASAALCNKGFNILLHSCICNEYLKLAELKSKTFGYEIKYHKISNTVGFNYYHPLSSPLVDKDYINEKIQLSDIEGENILIYGMIEALAKCCGKYLVYDPQGNESFAFTGSKANHLAIILNKKEALDYAETESNDIIAVGRNIMDIEGAEVVVIKNGVHGAVLFEGNNITEIPLFKIDHVWPIGSGDIFSAVFAWKWIIEKKQPYASAVEASKYTASYCENKRIPLIPPQNYPESKIKSRSKKIYIAGPFFTTAERWLINEVHSILEEFGNFVFSPYHDIGYLDSINDAFSIANKDLEALEKSDVLLAIVSGTDPGTLFEIGYAKSLDKEIIVYCENVKTNDLTMLIGTECKITNDLATALYMTSW